MLVLPSIRESRNASEAVQTRLVRARATTLETKHIGHGPDPDTKRERIGHRADSIEKDLLHRQVQHQIVVERLVAGLEAKVASRDGEQERDHVADLALDGLMELVFGECAHLDQALAETRPRRLLPIVGTLDVRRRDSSFLQEPLVEPIGGMP